MPDRRKSAERLFGAVLELPLEERAAFLDQECREDPEMRRVIEELLRDNERLGSFMARPVIDAENGFQPGGFDNQARRAGSAKGPERFHPGQIVANRFLVVRFIARGGMGEVYEVKDQLLQGDAVALKIIRPEIAADTANLHRFEREVILARKVAHPNLCPIYEIFRCEEPEPAFLFLTMKLLRGETLETWVRDSSVRPDGDAVEIAGQLISGVVAMHAAGIIHRDLKPNNIMLERSGGRLNASIMDFGLARAHAADATMLSVGVIAGTQGYMAPKLYRGQPPTKATDLFALGVVLHQVFSRERPASSQTGGPAPAASLRAGRTPSAYVHAVEGLLAVDPEVRCRAFARICAGGQSGTAMMGPVKLKWPRWAFVAVSACILVAVAVLFRLFHHAPVLAPKDTVVLADFANSTGDPVFDETLRQGMAVQLEQSPYLSLISDGRIQQVLAMMGKPPDVRLNSDIAREVCERTASAALLEGSISSLGSQYVLGLRAQDCRTGQVLAVQQVQAERKEDVLKALSQIASRFRSEVGESLKTRQTHDTPLVEATTPSLDALKAYSTGLTANFTLGAAPAIPLFQRAIEIDPGFALAYARLAHAYGQVGESDLAAQSATKAYQLRARSSDWERFFIVLTYQVRVTGNTDQLQQTADAWAQIYPRVAEPHMGLGSDVYSVTGRYEKAIEESRRCIELDPGFAGAYDELAGSQLAVGQIDQAEKTIELQSERKLEIPDLFVELYDIEFVKGDKAAMEHTAALGHASPGAEDWTYVHEAFAAAYTGHQQQADGLAGRAAEMALTASQRDRAALFEDGPAVWHGLFGDSVEARRQAGEALALSKGREVEYGAALAFALAGDSARAQTLANDLETRFREDTAVHVDYLPSIRAILAIKHNQPAKAIDLLQNSTPYELGQTRAFVHGSFGALYPAYVRGQAYLALHQGAQAAVEFHKVIDHPGIVVSDPVGALAHLQLGRAYVQLGDPARARMAYQDFLSLWKDADPGVPIFQQAKQEYAALQ